MKNISKNILLLAFLLSINIAEAQFVAPQSINAAGNLFSQTNGSMYYTLGDLAIFTLSNSGSIGQGFIASTTAFSSVLSVQEPDKALINLKVYPNPVADLLYVEILESTVDFVQIVISTTDGKMISSEKYAAFNNKIIINISKFSPAAYFIHIKDSIGQIIGTYKIIKNH